MVVNVNQVVTSKRLASFQAFVPRILGMYVIAALALLFYVSKVRERYFPGEPAPESRLPRVSRSAQLRGLQPPAVARAAGADVLLVAPVVGLHPGVQTQPPLPRRAPAHVGRHLTCERPRETPHVMNVPCGQTRGGRSDTRAHEQGSGGHVNIEAPTIPKRVTTRRSVSTAARLEITVN